MIKSKLGVVVLPLIMASLASCGGGGGGSTGEITTAKTTQTTQEVKTFTPEFSFGVDKAILSLKVTDSMGTNDFTFYKLNDQYGSIEFDPTQNSYFYNFFLKKPGSSKYTGFTASESGPMSSKVTWEEEGEVEDVFRTGLNYLYNVPSGEYASKSDEEVHFGLKNSDRKAADIREISERYDYANGVSINYCNVKAENATPAMKFIQKRVAANEGFTAVVTTVDVYQPTITFPLNIPTVA